MDIFMDSPADSEDGGGLFLNDLMADSQISNLELSSQMLAHRPYTLSTPPSSRPSSGPSYKATPPRPPSRRVVPPPPPPLARNHIEAAPKGRSTTASRHARHDSSTSIDSWDSDADFVDRRQVPRHHNESQRDLAERISNLTKTINANAAFCLEVSGKMVELARENKHLLDSTKSTLETYVWQPALKIPGILKAYYPGLQDGLQDGLVIFREYEAQLRRTVQNCANGRDMARAQGVGGSAGEGSGRRVEMSRLKDRLVEQDALLRNSSQHVQRLIREREALKKQLHQKKWSSSGQDTDLMGLGVSDAEDTDLPYLQSDGENNEGGKERPSSEKDMAALADHLSEMRVLMDRLALHEATNYERRDSNARGHDSGDELAADEEDPEWTLL